MIVICSHHHLGEFFFLGKRKEMTPLLKLFHPNSLIWLPGESDFDKCCSIILKLSDTVVITNGKEGSSIITNSQKIKIKPHPVQAIDTVGAGDTFAGAFLYGINNGLDFENAGNLASKLSSKVVTKLGPRLDKEVIESIKLSNE